MNWLLASLCLYLATLLCLEELATKQLLVPWGDAKCAYVDLKYNSEAKVYEMKGWNPTNCPPAQKLHWSQVDVDSWHKMFNICSRRFVDTRHCADVPHKSGFHPMTTEYARYLMTK